LGLGIGKSHFLQNPNKCLDARCFIQGVDKLVLQELFIFVGKCRQVWQLVVVANSSDTVFNRHGWRLLLRLFRQVIFNALVHFALQLLFRLVPVAAQPAVMLLELMVQFLLCNLKQIEFRID
jgi:hypothetical protein